MPSSTVTGEINSQQSAAAIPTESLSFHAGNIS